MASTIFSRLIRSFFFCLELVSSSSARSSCESFTRSSSISSLRTASAPMSASKALSPYCSRASRYSSSVSSCCGFSGVSPGIDDHVVLEVDHLLQAGGLHVQQGAQAAGHGLEEPDVHDRGGQLDVAHPLAADAAVRDLHAAAVADHALVLHAAVLAAGAFPVLLRAEDPLAEQAVLFRAVGAVVDRLRLLDLAERPAADVVRAGQADLAPRRNR